MWESLLVKAKEVMERAHAPYSKFHVGACLVTESGALYAGCNVENASYSLTIDAEANAIAQMVAAGETSIQAILVVCYGDVPCSPCGACRQRIREFAEPDVPVHMCCVMGNGEVRHEMQTIGYLVPNHFGSEYLDE